MFLWTRHRQVADEFHAVARLEFHGMRLRKILGLHLRTRVEQVADLSVVLVPQVELTPIPVVVDAQDVLQVVRRGALYRDHVIRKRRHQPLATLRPGSSDCSST